MWGVGSRSPAAWSAREIELQALATLAALAQISTPSAAHFLKSHQLLVQKLRRIEIGKKTASPFRVRVLRPRQIAGSTRGSHFEDAIRDRSRPMTWSGTRAQLSFRRD
jgi:hypothetical protein